MEFQETEKPLTDEYLTILANTAALEGVPSATALVGVAEAKDSASGVVNGRIVGLGGDLHKIAEQVSQRATMTGPVPVHVDIFEENVGTSRPILRVEVSPRLPPHYDQKARSHR